MKKNAGDELAVNFTVKKETLLKLRKVLLLVIADIISIYVFFRIVWIQYCFILTTLNVFDIIHNVMLILFAAIPIALTTKLLFVFLKPFSEKKIISGIIGKEKIISNAAGVITSIIIAWRMNYITVSVISDAPVTVFGMEMSTPVGILGSFALIYLAYAVMVFALVLFINSILEKRLR